MRRTITVLMLAAAASLAAPSPAHAGMLWADVCTAPDTKALPFCDTTKSIEARVADYVGRVPLANKTRMMVNNGAAYTPLQIPPYQFGSEGLHGPLQPCVCTADNKSCACPTSFPCPSAMATAFNDSLYLAVGHADGVEARAINNLRNHETQNNYGDGLDYWSPTVNMQRDARWGRNQEVPGEDPMLSGSYVTQFVRGLQGEVGGEDPSHLQIAACCKHFVANSLENWQNWTRHNFDAQVTMADLYNYYLPPFRACVMEGHSKGIMCSYNEVNGVPSCANDWMLQTTLRESWRFDGYVTSDCGAIGNECAPEPDGHGWAADCTNASALSVLAGTDTDCGGVYNSHLTDAVSDGYLKESDVDTSFGRLVDIQMRLGLFDNDKAAQPYFNYGIDDIDSAAHQKLALEAAHQSIVLLKNTGGTLPLKPGINIAVVGPHFNATETMLSNYHGSRCLDGTPGTGKDFGCITTPLDAIMAANAGGTTVGVQGCAVAGGTDNTTAAVAAASRADAVVILAGIDQTQEREGLDRTITTLPGFQVGLVNAVLALKKPTVLVLMNGGAMSLGSIKDTAPAIVDAYYGGEQGGQAIADVLFGRYNPSGKLAATMYPPDYVNQIPLTGMGLSVGVGRTHMFYTGTPEFAFGQGMSYTSWTLAAEADAAAHDSSGRGQDRGGGGDGDAADTTTVVDAHAAVITLRASIRNTGGMGGKQTVLAFWRPRGGDTAAEQAALSYGMRQKLVAYGGATHVAPGEAALVELTVKAKDLAIADDTQAGTARLYPGQYDLVLFDGENEAVASVDLTAFVRGEARELVF